MLKCICKTYTNVFLGLQTFHLELPENRQRQPVMLTVRHRYMCIITGAYIYRTNKIKTNWMSESSLWKKLLNMHMTCEPQDFEARHQIRAWSKLVKWLS